MEGRYEPLDFSCSSLLATTDHSFLSLYRGFAIYPHGTRYEGSWLGGKREGRGTLTFCEGAIYEGRFKDDNMDGQGTLQLGKNIIVPSIKGENNSSNESFDLQEDWMIPVAFQSDISHIHQKAGFTHGGD
jgi:hypothetical protein